MVGKEGGETIDLWAVFIPTAGGWLLGNKRRQVTQSNLLVNILDLRAKRMIFPISKVIIYGMFSTGCTWLRIALSK